jgi:hypothetical protein
VEIDAMEDGIRNPRPLGVSVPLRILATFSFDAMKTVRRRDCQIDLHNLCKSQQASDSQHVAVHEAGDGITARTD